MLSVISTLECGLKFPKNGKQRYVERGHQAQQWQKRYYGRHKEKIALRRASLRRVKAGTV